MIYQQKQQHPSLDELWHRLQTEALETLDDEPDLSHLLNETVLAPGVASFEDAVASTVAYRLSSHPSLSSSSHYSQDSLRRLFTNALHSRDADSALEHGHFMVDSVCADALTVIDRDPACETLLEVIVFSKGFAALVCHRAARQKWYQTTKNGRRRSMMALYLQSLASAAFGVDIHPAATIGAGILLDHGTGVVIGETAFVGDGCTILQGVTLGGTGKEAGDRHPKVGKNVFIGAGAKILGNIIIGDDSKIGAGAVVLKAVPNRATAVGSPARIILPKQQEKVDAMIVTDESESFTHSGMSSTESLHVVGPDKMSDISSFSSTVSLVETEGNGGQWRKNDKLGALARLHIGPSTMSVASSFSSTTSLEAEDDDGQQHKNEESRPERLPVLGTDTMRGDSSNSSTITFEPEGNDGQRRKKDNFGSSLSVCIGWKNKDYAGVDGERPHRRSMVKVM